MEENKETCAICKGRISPEKHGIVEIGSVKLHPLCMCIRNITDDRSIIAGEIKSSYVSELLQAHHETKATISFANCVHGKYDFRLLRLVSNKFRCFFCRECTLTDKDRVQIMTDWSGYAVNPFTTPMPEFASVVERKPPVDLKTLYDMLSQNTDPNEVLAQYSDRKIQNPQYPVTTPFKEAVVGNGISIDDFADFGYTINETCKLGLSLEHLLSSDNGKFLLQRKTFTVDLLVCEKFGCSFSKMILGGVGLGDFVRAGYTKDELLKLQFCAPGFLAAGGNAFLLCNALQVSMDTLRSLRADDFAKTEKKRTIFSGGWKLTEYLVRMGFDWSRFKEIMDSSDKDNDSEDLSKNMTDINID